MITLLKRKHEMIIQSVISDLKCRNAFCTNIQQLTPKFTIKSKMSGSSEHALYDKYRSFNNSTINKVHMQGVTVVRSKSDAENVIRTLSKFQNRQDHSKKIQHLLNYFRPHCWDTEGIDIDLKKDSAIGNGQIISAQAFLGPDVDFGNGPRLFIDNFAQNSDLILNFQQYFEDSNFKKIWHNYGYDRHQFYNHGIDVKGFLGDTMHMTRLVDPSRGPKQYSLARITEFYEQQLLQNKKNMINRMKIQNLTLQKFWTSSSLTEQTIREIKTQMLKSGNQSAQFDSIKNQIASELLIGKEDFHNHQVFQDCIGKLQKIFHLEPPEIINKIKKTYPKASSSALGALQIYEKNFLQTNVKVNMRQLFAQKKELKTGKVGKTYEFPTLIRLHTDPELIEKWINYSTLDAEITYFLYLHLKEKLEALKTDFEGMGNLFQLYQQYWRIFGECLTNLQREGIQIDVAHLDKIQKEAENDVIRYNEIFLKWVQSTQPGLELFNPASTQQLQQLLFAPFQRSQKAENKSKTFSTYAQRQNLSFLENQDLKKIEAEQQEKQQIKSNSKLNASQQQNSTADQSLTDSQEQDSIQDGFNDIEQTGEDPEDSSGYLSDGRKKSVRQIENDFPQTKQFKVPNTLGLIPAPKIQVIIKQILFLKFSQQDPKNAKVLPINQNEGDGQKLETQDPNNSQENQKNEDLNAPPKEEEKKKPRKITKKIIPQQEQTAKIEQAPQLIAMSITGLGIEPVGLTVSGLPSADTPAMKQLAGDPQNGVKGKIYEYYESQGDLKMAEEARSAIKALIDLRATETLLQTFISPLRQSAIKDQDHRVHCSLNINTETGRLSSRKPNLQNQPALDQDIYKIRKAFIAPEGKKFIVADYGQLELRILAHMTDCKNMIQAFLQGGDFHSRTAIGMYPNIKQQIEEGKLLLEWDQQKNGPPPFPLVKDQYAAERKQAKTMNFSIAYGKSAHGFAKDWNCSLEQAQKALDAWYSDRIEVKEWQEKVQETALKKGWTLTLMGRYRGLSKNLNQMASPSMVQHGLRAAINTPIQGGAADIVIAAMVKIYHDEKLKNLGYQMLLQIHDELILEGPQENAKSALQRVQEIMQNPLDDKLLLPLEVDAKIGSNWYQCQ